MIKTLFTCSAILGATAVMADPIDQIVSVGVLPGWTTPDGDQMAALHIQLAPGWKTYWRAPGDAGIPPLIQFSGSDNITATQMQWPVPQVFHEGGIRSIGYYDDVVIPVALTPGTPGAPMVLSGEMQIGVCDEICVPAHLSFSASIPAGGERAPAIVAALLNRPLTGQEAGLSAATCAFEPKDNGMMITTTLVLPSAGQTEDIVIEAGNPAIWVSEPTVERSGDQITAAAYMVHAAGQSFALDRSDIRITLLGSDHAVDVQGCTPG